MPKRGKSWTYEAAMREYLHAREFGQLTEHTSATVGEYLESSHRSRGAST